MSDLIKTMTRDHATMKVRLWDLGPRPPEAPDRPELPKGKEGEPEYDLNMVEFRGALAKYENDLQLLAVAKKAFADWHRTYQGPYEREMYSADAMDARARDPERYVVSDDRLPNHGLPKGRKAGPWHHAELKRQAEERRRMQQIADRDPIFGTQGMIGAIQ